MLYNCQTHLYCSWGSYVCSGDLPVVTLNLNPHLLKLASTCSLDLRNKKNKNKTKKMILKNIQWLYSVTTVVLSG